MEAVAAALEVTSGAIHQAVQRHPRAQATLERLRALSFNTAEVQLRDLAGKGDKWAIGRLLNTRYARSAGYGTPLPVDEAADAPAGDVPRILAALARFGRDNPDVADRLAEYLNAA